LIKRVGEDVNKLSNSSSVTRLGLIYFLILDKCAACGCVWVVKVVLAERDVESVRLSLSFRTPAFNMRFLPLLSLLSVALASPLHDQITFNPHGPSSLIPSTLPTSISRSVLPKLLDLPLEHLSQLESHIGQWKEPKLVRLRGQNGARGSIVEVTEGEKSLLTLAQIRFVDVTDDMQEGGGETISADFVPTKYPSRLTNNSTSLSPLFKSISLDTMKAFLTKFTSFHTRYYRSQSGGDSQVYLLEHLKELHKSLNPKAKLTFREFQHEWIQKTIIVRWEPETKGIDYKDEEVVILSAHQVSLSLFYFWRKLS